MWRAAGRLSFLQPPLALGPISLDSILPTTTDGARATLDLGRRLAETWPAGTVVALTGDLGAGKTHLAKGVAGARGIDPAEVTSPTFTIVQEYADGGLVHLDLYRMASGPEVDGLGLDELFSSFDLALVEWPEHAFGRLPSDTVWLRLEHLGGDRRRISQIDTPRADGDAAAPAAAAPAAAAEAFTPPELSSRTPIRDLQQDEDAVRPELHPSTGGRSRIESGMTATKEDADEESPTRDAGTDRDATSEKTTPGVTS